MTAGYPWAPVVVIATKRDARAVDAARDGVAANCAAVPSQPVAPAGMTNAGNSMRKVVPAPGALIASIFQFRR